MTENHNDYWQKRVDDIFEHQDMTDEAFFKELSRIYSEASTSLQKDLFEFYGKYAEDSKISLSEARERLSRVDLSDYRANVEKYRRQAEKDPELLRRINEQYMSSRANRMDVLNMEIVYKMGVLQGVLEKSFEGYLRSSAEYAYRKAMGGRSGNINGPALEEVIKTPFNGYNYSQQLWGHVDNLAKDLKDTLKRGFIRGEHPKVLARNLSVRYKVANHRAETLIRTDGTSVINRATARRYMDAGLEFYRILVHMDHRTTEICRKHHAEDKRYRLDEMKVGVNAPPFHFNCRSGIVPDEEELTSEELHMSAQASDDWRWPEFDRNNIISKEDRRALTQYASDRGIALQGIKRFDGDIELLKTYIDGAYDVLKIFPNLTFEERRPLTLMLGNMQDDDFAITRGHVIELNAAMFRDRGLLESRYQSLLDVGWFAKGTSYKSIIHHEMGHIIDNKLKLDSIGISERIAGAKVQDLMAYIEKHLSEYASSFGDGIEIPSEALSSFLGNDPSSFALQFVREMLKYR
ncbi:TPA: minor capsid protein [Streptococcus suis]